jgi:hypothetical protein
MLGEEHRLMVFESAVFRGVFGPENDEATDSWKKLHHEGLHNLYSLQYIIRMMKIKEAEMGGTCGVHVGNKCIQNFGWKL